MKNGDIAFTTEKVSNGIRLIVKGRIDSINAVELGYALGHAVREGQPNLILNMEHVEYLCSTGIRVIIKAYKEVLDAGGKFEIENPSECVRDILEVIAWARKG